MTRIERIGDAVLYLGDCRNILCWAEGHRLIDAVITDPPYGISYSPAAGGGGILDRNGRRYEKRFTGDDLVFGDDQPFDPAHLLGIAPTTVLWGGNHYADKLPPSSGWLIWDKRRGTTRNDFADCEMAWTSRPVVARVLPHLWNGMLRDSERGQERIHPTQKPIAVMEWCLRETTEPGQTVLDAYMGSGTTGVACAKLGRKFIGIEIHEPYHAYPVITHDR